MFLNWCSVCAGSCSTSHDFKEAYSNPLMHILTIPRRTLETFHLV